MRQFKALYLVLLVLLVLATRLANAAQPQGSPALSAVIQEANKEGKLKLSWGEGTLGGTKRMALYEQLMNKMFGSNVKIGFTPGPSMPAMGSQIATELAAGQPAASDVYIGAESYLVPLVKRKIFLEVEWPKLMPGRITAPMVEGDGQSLRVFSGLPGTPYNKIRVPKNDTPKTLKDFLKPFWKGKIASTPYVTGLNLLAAKELWGREAALDYVKQFSKQVSGLIRCNEMDRVVTGEFLALVMDCNGARTFELQAQRRAAGACDTVRRRDDPPFLSKHSQERRAPQRREAFHILFAHQGSAKTALGKRLFRPLHVSRVPVGAEGPTS